MRSGYRVLLVSSIVAIATGAACLPGSGPPLASHQDDAGVAPGLVVDDGGSPLADVDLGDPFALTGLLPSHGPFTGGTRTVLSGRGFASSIEVWIGPTQLDASSVFASSPTRVSLVTPPGAAGPADVRVRNVATGQERTLAGGFVYDALVVTPSSGATTGGTRISVRGSGTRWAAASVVAVGGAPCADLAVTDGTDLACTTPPGSPGSTDVTVTNADGSVDQARDAFTYADAPDGFRGGLYGNALSGTLHVFVFDAATGVPLPGARVIAGSKLSSAVLGVIDASGAATLVDPTLNGAVTVTVAAKCHQPVTFVDVPVDTVTAYLSVEMDPACAGDPPSSGNFRVVELGAIDGELVWTGGIEFQRAGWTNVPAPTGNERLVAYVWPAGGSPLDPFVLPPADSAVTPASDGSQGYRYEVSTTPGTHTVYALAGLEDRSVTPARFEAYAMGVAPGVLVQPGAKTIGVDIPMTTLLDHALDTMPMPPSGSPRGPDRLVSTLAVDLGSGQFAALPLGAVTTLLPISGPVSFIGVPALGGTLSGASYDLTEAAVTGESQSAPASVVAGVETTNANDPLAVTGFLPVPALIQPSAAAWTGTHVAMQASGPIDLAVVQISSGGGLVIWQIVAPGSDLSFDVPDLSQVPDVASLVHGPISTSFAVARIDSFDYGRLRYGHLSSAAWSAYALDTAAGSY